MSTVPADIDGKIAFFKTRTATPDGAWTLNSVAIGSSAAEITSLGTKVQACQDARDEQLAAKAALKSATLNLKNTLAAMADAGSDVIKKVKARAATDGNNIYVLADLPAPATPSPVPPPGKPFDFKATLEDNGALTFDFKCPNPRSAVGTVYQISRQLPGGDMIVVGTSGKKEFTDDTLPSTLGPVTYQIIAVRSTAKGPMAEFTVKFGIGGGGEMTASIVPPSPKLAA